MMVNSLLINGYATETKGEEWRDIKGYEGLYQVSNFGRVKSLERVTHFRGKSRVEPERIMKVTHRSGYEVLILRKCNARVSKQVHRLVAEAFIPNPHNYPIVNHKDFIRTNNRVDNLEWCTQKHNVQWSSDRMCHPFNTSKKSNTGEKYISIEKNGRYKICIYYKRKSYATEKSTLEQAIQWRNEQWTNLTGESWIGTDTLHR